MTFSTDCTRTAEILDNIENVEFAVWYLLRYKRGIPISVHEGILRIELEERLKYYGEIQNWDY